MKNLKHGHIKFYALSLQISLIFVLFFPRIQKAQSTGYLGKKFIVKTNLVNGMRLGFNNLDVEYVVSRRFTINLFYESMDYTRGATGVKRKTGIVKPRNGNGSYQEFTTLNNGRTSGSIMGIGAKIYFNRIVPAPYGYYTSFFVGFGKVNFDNFDASYSYKEKLGTSIGDPDGLMGKASVSGLNGSATLYTAELPSIGYQRIYKRFLVIDAKLSALTQYCALPDNLANAMEHNYFVKSNTVGYAVGNFNLGLSAYIKIGILIF